MGWTRTALIGLIVGEGSFTHHDKIPVVSVQLHEDDPQPLLALQREFGGELHGPYSYRGADGTTRRSRRWYLRGPALEGRLIDFIDAIPPSRKRDQFDLWLAKYWPQHRAQEEMFHGPHSRKPNRTREVSALERRNRDARVLRLPGVGPSSCPPGQTEALHA